MEEKMTQAIKAEDADRGMRRRALLREIDASGFGGKGLGSLFGEYAANDVACIYQCRRALIVPGQIYPHELSRQLPGRLHGYAWVINAITRKKWDGDSRLDWVEEALTWMCKWARRHNVDEVHVLEGVDAENLNTGTLQEIFELVKSTNPEWRVELVSREPGASENTGRRRRGFSDLRGVT
jgi:hypothetical protein